MKISTKGRYALRMLLNLAEQARGEFLPLKETAERLDISKQYLEQIIPILKTSNFLRANRGKQGGYMLAKPPTDISVGQVLRLTEGSLAPVACLEGEVNTCERAAGCMTLPMWEKLDRMINDYFDSVSLQDLLDQFHEQGANVYVI